MADLSRPNTSNALLRLLAEILQCFDKLEILSGFSDADEIVYAKFSVQRTRLVLWGSSLRNEDRRDEPSPMGKVTALYDVASVREPYTERYGLRPLLEPESQNSMQVRSGSRGFELFKRTFNAYTRRLIERIGNAKFAEHPKLYVTDVSRFMTFIQNLEQCLDDLYTPKNGEVSIEKTLRWRDLFQKEMSTIAEEPDSLHLLVKASSGPRDAFGNFASRRLLEREGRPFPTLWKWYRTFEDVGDRLIFNFWHRLLDSLVPKRLQSGSSEPRADLRAAASSEETPGQPPGYLAFCSRFGGLHSDLAEVDLSTIGSNAELSRAIRKALPHLWRTDRGCNIRRALTKPASVRLIQ
ncbi:MAG: hypothetical protein Q9184_007207, partial [Pyrenodesmia sp. 2 TL-2023]